MPDARELGGKKWHEVVPVPPAKLTAAPTSLDEPWVPRGPKLLARWLTERDYEVRLTRAIGPRINADGAVGVQDCYTLAIAAQGRGRRVVAVWRWMAGSWKIDDVQIFPGGTVVTMARAKEFLDG